MWILVTVFFVSLVIFHLLEPLAPIIDKYRAGVTRRGYVADCIAAAVNGPGLSGLETIAFTLLVNNLHAHWNILGGLNFWAQFAIFFLVNDFLRYWFHRWYHESNLLWRVHRVHHTITQMDAMSVFRLHILEAVIKNGLIFLPLRLLGIEEYVIILYSSIDVVKGFWHHANLRTTIGPLNYIFNSPEQHWWHHEPGRGMSHNYGSTLSIWDQLFGTFLYRPGQWPTEIGVKGMDDFPDGYLGQMLSIRDDDETLLRKLQQFEPSKPVELHVARPAPGASAGSGSVAGSG